MGEQPGQRGARGWRAASADSQPELFTPPSLSQILTRSVQHSSIHDEATINRCGISTGIQ